MLLYLFVFIISIISTRKVQLTKENSLLYYAYSFFAVAPLVFLVAIRDYNVGTDTINYVYLFESAVENKNNLTDYISSHPSFEFGFLFYNFCLAQLLSSVESYFVVTYGIIVGLTYLSALKVKKYISMHIFVFVFLFIFFSESLNTMRQYLALSFVFFALACLFLKKINQSIIMLMIACTFHASAVFSFLVVAFYFLSKKYPMKNHTILYLLICGFVFFVAININQFSNMGLLPVFENKLSNHLSDSSNVSNSHIVIYFSTLLFLLYVRNKYEISDFMILMATFTMLFYISPSVNAILYRLTLYFNIIICFSIAYAHRIIFDKTSKLLCNMLLCLYLYFYYFSFVLNGTSEVIPYTSKILGIY